MKLTIVHAIQLAHACKHRSRNIRLKENNIRIRRGCVHVCVCVCVGGGGRILIIISIMVGLEGFMIIVSMISTGISITILTVLHNLREYNYSDETGSKVALIAKT